MSNDYDRTGLIGLIKSEFALDWQGIHGANHWARVLHHGKNIGQIRKADLCLALPTDNKKPLRAICRQGLFGVAR